tara:strand:+ start:1685 stop:2782 length:1098 start_codon:yes stop_codon:yes gene_type:complete
MTTYGFNSWNSWDPLKKCMVGNVYPAGWFSNYKDTRVADALSKVNEDTREDMLSLKGILESASVEVVQTPADVSLRGEPVKDIQDYMDRNQQVITKPLIAPRDEFIVLGNTLINTSSVNTYKHWGPWQGCDDYIQTRTTDFDHHIEPPSIMRAGKDVQVDISFHNGETKKFAQEWIPKYFPDFRVNTIEMGGHSDSVICLVKPGLLLSHTKISNYEETYPGWDVIYVGRPEDEYTEAYWRTRESMPNVVNYWVKGEEENEAFHNFISKWWNAGHVFETQFNVNCLSIDPSTLICNYYDKDLAQQLKKYNVELVESPMRHRHFWDNGIHCCTVDLYREGEQQDYFPQRTKGQHFGKIWGNNETRRN